MDTARLADINLDLGAMDEETIQLLIQWQLEDLSEVASSAKGKGREDAISDQDLAIQIYQQELERSAALCSDRSMTRSIAEAVIADAACLAQAASEEKQAAEDHEIAYRMRYGSNPPKTNAGSGSKEDALDDEFLEKLQALYVSGVQADSSQRDEEEEPAVAESSSWAASRKTRHLRHKLHKCASCFSDTPFFDIARLPCGDEYCRDCVGTLFRMSITDESLFPPRCCKQVIPVDSIRLFVARDILVEFEHRRTELETPDRTYCSNRRCSAFIPETKINGFSARCEECGTATCSNCKEAYHVGDCPTDVALQQVIQAGRENGWQQCYQCRRMIELEHGCNHMTCICKAEFCYLCGKRWRTCSCELFTYERLLARANVLQQREPPGIRRPVADVMRDLCENHECRHQSWQYIRGAHRCEECYYNLPNYIFRCQQCQLQACNRCRKNRL